jgi:hypothetical protein
MMSAADRIIEETMKYTLRPKRGNREKVIIAILEFLINEYSYTPWDFGYNDKNDKDVIDVKNIRDLIEELRSTVTIEEPAQEHLQDPP